jgi:hypothetical protein
VPARVKFAYEPGPDGTRRPYLWLDLSIEAGPTIRTRGLLDTGADVTTLDRQYAEALGLEPGQLERVQTRGPAGTATGWKSTTPVRAVLPGAPELAVPLYPRFVPDMPIPLWGRDFMSVYSLALDQRALQFSLFAQEPRVGGDPNGS